MDTDIGKEVYNFCIEFKRELKIIGNSGVIGDDRQDSLGCGGKNFPEHVPAGSGSFGILWRFPTCFPEIRYSISARHLHDGFVRFGDCHLQPSFKLLRGPI
jgi:hypothetical protein